MLNNYIFCIRLKCNGNNLGNIILHTIKTVFPTILAIFLRNQVNMKIFYEYKKTNNRTFQIVISNIPSVSCVII